MRLNQTILTVLLSGIAAAQVQSDQGASPARGDYIAQGSLAGLLGSSHQLVGGRMQDPEKARITIAGTVTDASGTRNAQITIQAPGLLSYREDQGKAITFDGSQASTKTGSLSGNDKAVFESLLADFPDSIFLQVAAGGSIRRIGSHFRTDDGTAKDYTGPYWTVLAFSPKSRPGLRRGEPLQQDLFIAVDENTGFIAEVRTAMESGSGAPQLVTQTKFENWIQQDGQWFPGRIVRLENGRETLTFQTQQAIAGASAAVETFKP